MKSNRDRIIISLCVLGYLVSMHFHQGLKFAHLIVASITLFLPFLPDRFEKIRDLALPLVLTTLVYDSQRIYANWIRADIHVVEPYRFDLFFFGISSKGTILTPNEWWALHIHPLLDFVCGIAYIIFIPVFFGFAGFFRFGKTEEERSTGKQMAWAFFWVNVLGYSTYYWYPAAPPWYVALYGFGPADLSIPANLAGCARFDELVGIPIFKTWYGNSADVFGAVPSLHVAYPFLTFLFTLKLRKFRIVSFLFFVWVAFSAVYLNHHYLLDVLWGMSYSVAIYASFRLKSRSL